MQDNKPLTQEMIQQILEMRSKARHEEATRLYQAKQEEKTSIAKNLINQGVPLETISQATGLSIGEIEKLK